ncbi:MAG: UDP-N-acetylmuramoyl-L-alanine--D-glutamate ligase [bacterium]
MTMPPHHGMELSGKAVLVVGLGLSGLGAARFCAARGARVTVNDIRGEEPLAATLAQLPDGVRVVLGSHPEEVFRSAELIVLSPGVPPLPALDQARSAGVEIIGEIELAARHLQGQLIAVTGTNGKSTTTSWIGEMLAGLGRPLFVGGNLGEPLIGAAGTQAAGPDGIAVAELSSFQLETCTTLRPRVALLLNLAEDHLDRYAGMDEYIAAKARIFAAQTADDWAVINGDQPACLAVAEGIAARVARFSTTARMDPGASLVDDALCIRLPGVPRMRLSTRSIRLVGRHNLENAMAAILAAALAGATAAQIQAALDQFGGLPHRMQHVGEHDGVRFFNDSKATNVSAVVGSLTGFPGGYVLVAGGRHKGAPYTPLRPVLGAVRAVILIGEAADLLAEDLYGVAPLHRAKTLEEAVRLGAKLAQAGEAVVLSPACSSYDMFTNYERRGEAFAAAVARLEKGGDA